MKILKFGGTSVGSPTMMKKVAQIIKNIEGEKIVVLSAVSGTTNALVEINSCIKNEQKEEATKKLNALKNKYLPFIDELYSTDEMKKKAIEAIDLIFSEIQKLINQAYYSSVEKIIVVQGELISTQLFNFYVQENGMSVKLLDATDFIHTDINKEPDLNLIEKNIKLTLQKYEKFDFYITQGFICKNYEGGIDNLNRGGSDYTATIIGAVLKADEIQIWTDIDGIHNNDPRVVDKTEPIAEISFDEAGELAYFGAKILHPTCIIPAQQYNVPVRLKNTLNPEAFGTLITSKKNNKTIKAIAAKDGIIAIKIKSSRMMLAYGFLRRIFQVFEEFKKPIDLITTSEIAVSLTIDNAENLEEITNNLQQYGQVEVDKNQTIICIVGNFVAENKGIVNIIFDALIEIPIRMISFGGSKNNITILIPSDFKEKALKSLNKNIFKN